MLLVISDCSDIDLDTIDFTKYKMVVAVIINSNSTLSLKSLRKKCKEHFVQFHVHYIIPSFKITKSNAKHITLMLTSIGRCYTDEPVDVYGNDTPVTDAGKTARAR